MIGLKLLGADSHLGIVVALLLWCGMVTDALCAPLTLDATVPGTNNTKHIRLILADASKPVRGAKIGFNNSLSAQFDSSDTKTYSIWQFAYVQFDFNLNPTDTTNVKLALKELADKSGRPEVAHLAFCPSGMSFTSGMSSRFTTTWPSRTIALASVGLEYKPSTAAAGMVPSLTIYGSLDASQPSKIESSIAAGRNGSQWGIAVKWGDGHTYGDANDLVWILFDQSAKLRLPESGYPTSAPFELKILKESDGWLGNWETWQTPCADIAPYAQYQGDKSKACWFPNAYCAYAWRAFVAYHTRNTMPPMNFSLATRQVYNSGSEVAIQLAPSVSDFDTVKFYDGDILLWAGAKNAYNIYKTTWKNLPVGIRALNGVAYSQGKPKYVTKLKTLVVVPSGSTITVMELDGHRVTPVKNTMHIAGISQSPVALSPGLDILGRLNTGSRRASAAPKLMLPPAR